MPCRPSIPSLKTNNKILTLHLLMPQVWPLPNSILLFNAKLVFLGGVLEPFNTKGKVWRPLSGATTLQIDGLLLQIKWNRIVSVARPALSKIWKWTKLLKSVHLRTTKFLSTLTLSRGKTRSISCISSQHKSTSSFLICKRSRVACLRHKVLILSCL